MPSGPAPQVKLAIAHVLFIDIVGYSKLLITQQTELSGKLTVLVRETEQFQVADKKGGLVRIPTATAWRWSFATVRKRRRNVPWN